MIKIRRLRIGEGELFKQVRLIALQEAPYAFTTTFEAALQRSPESWIEQADASAQGPDRATFLAFEGDAPIGMMALYRDADRADLSDSPDEGELIQVWVSAEHRGKGVADQLIEAILGWAKENGFRRVRAGVNPGNDKALRFYLKYGFSPLEDGSGQEIANMFYKEINNFNNTYLDYSGRDDILSGGVKMIPIETSKGIFRVWTKRIGNNPTIKVLLLHGGPGMTHEYLEAFDSYFPAAGIEYYYYDQLDSYYSEQPNEPELLEFERFVEEVEQVRKALGLDKGNFYLYGHSWGGLLGIDYALKYQQNLKGLIISNMMSSGKQYDSYAKEVLSPGIDQAVLAEIKAIEAAEDYENPRYMELLIGNYYIYHILRMPFEEWPEPVSRSVKHLNPSVYIPLQGPSELGAGGKLLGWDRTNDLGKIVVPCLVIGAKYDTMDPKHMEWMSTTVQNGRYLYCPNGSHLALYDDQEAYFRGLTKFIFDVNAHHL